MNRVLRLGTRGSALALWQAGWVRDLLGSRLGVAAELVTVATTGDTDQRPFSQIQGSGIFARELEQGLLDGTLDLAVHSAKDLSLEADEASIAAWLPREDPRDAFCGEAGSIEALRDGARIATSSSRRTAVVAGWGRGIAAVPIRGNVPTRLRRFRERGDDGCLLALAGLRRLQLEDEIGFVLEVEQCVPEAGQGCVAVQQSPALADLDWSLLDDAMSRSCVAIERRVASLLGGGCERPVGAHVATSGTWHVFDATDAAKPRQLAGHLPFEAGELADPAAGLIDVAVEHIMQAMGAAAR